MGNQRFRRGQKNITSTVIKRNYAKPLGKERFGWWPEIIKPLLACPNHGNYCKPLGEINVLGGGQKHECGEMLETVPQS